MKTIYEELNENIREAKRQLDVLLKMKAQLEEDSLCYCPSCNKSFYSKEIDLHRIIYYDPLPSMPGNYFVLCPDCKEFMRFLATYKHSYKNLIEHKVRVFHGNRK